MFFLLFLLVPLVEVYFLIEIGGRIGAFPTIALVVLTAALGAMLVRAQGFSTYLRVQRQLALGESPAQMLLEGLALFVAGALLLTPGFFTDAVGFALLTPPLRRRIIEALLQRALRAQARRSHGRVIDVEVETRRDKIG
ncbi:MAG: FxsA family protein [Gammaproteobacteria bacterium]